MVFWDVEFSLTCFMFNFAYLLAFTNKFLGYDRDFFGKKNSNKISIFSLVLYNLFFIRCLLTLSFFWYAFVQFQVWTFSMTQHDLSVCLALSSWHYNDAPLTLLSHITWVMMTWDWHYPAHAVLARHAFDSGWHYPWCAETPGMCLLPAPLALYRRSIMVAVDLNLAKTKSMSAQCTKCYHRFILIII